MALLCELSRPGKRAVRFPEADVPVAEAAELLPAEHIARATPRLPELSEPELVRHFVNLSSLNMSVDTNFYPLGSCTMKYNPKRNERLAELPGFLHLHPFQDESSVQGLLQLLWELQQMLAEVAGLPAVSLQPAAGAHGELTALLIADAYFRDRGEPARTKVLIPDSAHGTNPASATIAGFKCQTIRSNERGLVDLRHLESQLGDDVAVFMITNPNTLGLFESQIERIAELVHGCGALLYCDGANMNAIAGITRPGDFGADMMHYNIHKTFSSPHGSGGPGAGPIAVRDFLEPYLPVPTVQRRAEDDADGQPKYYLDYDRPKSIGRVRSFFGNVGVLIRGYCYLRTLGPDGLRRMAEDAVLNANYVLAGIKDLYPVPYGERCMHEFVATTVPHAELPAALAAWQKRHMLPRKPELTALDVAKRLLDFGFHPPTVYFPLVVPEALMIEPTESESKETLEAFIAALRRIRHEGPATAKAAPQSTSVSRPDEVKAARTPVLNWQAAQGSCSETA